MKKAFLFVVLFVLSMVCYAQSDFEIASSFMSKKGITLLYDTYSKNRAKSNKPYSIFHGADDKGFAIVKNGIVVGYSTEDYIDEENMPTALSEMLMSSSKNLTRKTEPIEPLIKTKWGQYYFAKTYLNVKPDEGICVVVAYAQLVHFWGIPQTYEEFTIDDEFNHQYGQFPITTFDHSKLLDEYINGEYTQENIDEIAKFYFYISRIFHSDTDKEKILNVDYHFLNGFNAENRNSEFDNVLDKGIPFVTAAENHAFVVDGRDSEGRYHTNFGWGGGGDGYYYYLEKDDEVIPNETNKYTHGAPCMVYFTPKDWTSSVSSVNSDVSKSDDVYDIKGQKVGTELDGLSSGLYIKDGKKYVVK